MINHFTTSQNSDESPIVFPTDFPLKVMGKNEEGFLEAITEIIKLHDTAFNAKSVEKNHSRDGNYISLRIRVTATSREQLDNIYRALTSHPMVKVVF